MELERQSTTQLRAIAQSLGIGDIFGKKDTILIQEIRLKQQDMMPVPDVVPPPPEYDARLMLRPPSKSSSQIDMTDILQNHIARGLHVSFPDPEHWHMQFGKKEDNGTMRMPLRHVLNCANDLLK